MTIQDRRELERLLSSLFDGELSAEERARMAEMLRHDPACRLLYLEHVDQHAQFILLGPALGSSTQPARPKQADPELNGGRSRLYRSGPWIMAGLVGVALLLFLGRWNDVPKPQPDTVSVVEIEGDATVVTANGTIEALVTGQELSPRDLLTTGDKESAVVLRLAKSGRLRLHANTQVQLPAVEKGLGATRSEPRMVLVKGYVEMETPTGCNLSLSTSHTDVALDHGRIVAWTSAEETRIDIEQGEGHLTRREDGKRVAVQEDSYLIVSSRDKDLKPIPMKFAGKPRHDLKLGQDLISTIAFSPDSQTVVGGGWNGLGFWRTDTGLPTRPHWRKPGVRVSSAFFSSGGKILTFLAHERSKLDELKFLNLDDTGSEPSGWKGEALGIGLPVSFPDGSKLATAANRGPIPEIKIWDVATGEVQTRIPAHLERISALAVFPDGKHIVSGSFDQTVLMWNVQTGEEARRFPVLQGAILALAVSPDGRRLAVGGRDGRITLWDTETATQQGELRAFPSNVKSVAFSPDGTTLAAVGDYVAAKVWDLTTFQELASYRGEGYRATAMSLSPDGRTLAVGDTKGHVTLWDMPER